MLIDRALYLPKSWTDDPDRCVAAKVHPDGLLLMDTGGGAHAEVDAHYRP